MNKFEICIMTGSIIGWGQMIYGYTDAAYYGLGIMILVCLLAIISYLSAIYVDKR